MTVNSIYLAILVMAAVTYLIRALPLLLIRREIKNRTVRSFLFYVPYAVLGAMTVPAVFYATDSVFSAAAGLGVALVLALCKKGLLTVAVGATMAVYLWEWIGSIL